MYKNINIILVAAFIFSACGGSRSGSVNLTPGANTKTVAMEPEWWKDYEEKEGYVMGTSEGLSRDKGGARMKAQNLILNDFRQKTKAIATGRSENFFKETGENLDSDIYQSFESIQNSVWEGAIEAWVEFNKVTVVEESTDGDGRRSNLYRHYILGGLDQAAADRKLLQAIKREKALFIEMEKTKTYKSLREDLERYKGKL